MDTALPSFICPEGFHCPDTWAVIGYFLLVTLGIAIHLSEGIDMSQFGGASMPQTPWYKENPFWGAIGLTFTFGLTGLGFALTGHPTLGLWLLAAALLFAVMALWIAAWGSIKNTKARRLTLTIGLILLLATFYLVSKTLTRTPRLGYENNGNGEARDKPEVVITWSDPSPITAGTPLSSDQLNAKASVDGRFAYTPNLGTILPVGDHNLIGIFTAADIHRYPTPFTKVVHITVNPGSSPTQGKVISESERKELHEVDEFIARKDEFELRKLFDFDNSVHCVVRHVRRDVWPTSNTPAEAQALQTCFASGNGHIDLRFLKLTRTGNQLRVDFIPGKVGILNTTGKYAESRKTLSDFCASPELPSNVRAALKDFDATVQKDTDLMFDWINDTLSSDPKSIRDNDDPSSPLSGTATNAYWMNFFIPLHPSAEKVNKAIRIALDTK